ncbi:hypothetical protein [Halobacillus yeomjeoni]|uniref:DUF8042 domain-containing protein n=1 Tax=Halobacillus yeomjeoni TaxID=311194 RepID=A0A931HX83_9BACI|nr:hypothetical protein [Halobacillus yeomjeoni]MBH0230891.1 hypothetical protein [Halobacillus yeomjeoni]
MSQLTMDQTHMLNEYNQLLDTLSEAFEYLETHIEEEAPPQAQQVFEDLLMAFGQVTDSHGQMLILFRDEKNVHPLIEDFHDIVNLLQSWFVKETNLQKKRLLVESVVPVFESWRTRMQAFLNPYIVH